MTPHDDRTLDQLWVQFKHETDNDHTDPKFRFQSKVMGYANTYTANEMRKQRELISMLRDVLIDYAIFLPTLGRSIDEFMGDCLYQDWMRDNAGLITGKVKGKKIG
jgi:hypothetical protein